MKCFAKGHKQYQSKKCLIVDGYNVIPRLQRKSLNYIENLEYARTSLVEKLGEYHSFSGDHVIVVFDAYLTTKPGAQCVYDGVEIYFTLKNETADDSIERLVYQLRDVYPEITVATSDFAEQQVIFGGGALRISAEELVARLAMVSEKIHRIVESNDGMQKAQVRDVIQQDIANILEKWRRQ